MDLTALKRLLGLIQVTESGDQIRLTGLPGDFRRAIYEIWGTDRFAGTMFTHVGASEVSFNRWFAPDVVYMFQRALNTKSRKFNVRALKRVVEQMFEHTWLKDTRANKAGILDYSKLALFKFSPLEHQDTFYKTYDWVVPRYRLKGYLLAAGPGTGKTYMGLTLAEMLHADMVVIVCPKNAVHRVWYNSIRGEKEEDCLFKKKPPAWTSLDDSPPPRRGCRHFIVHYDGLEKFLEQLPTLSFNNVVILLDESHNVNDDESIRAELYLRLCALTRSHHVLHESGTPVKAVGGEVVTLFKAVDPMFDADAEARFKAIYGKSASAANDILAARLGRLAFKVDAKLVVKAQAHEHPRRIKIPNGEEYTLEAVREDMRKFVKERAEYYARNMREFVNQYEAILKHFERTLVSREQKKEYDTYRAYIRLIRTKYDAQALKVEAMYCNQYEKKVIMPTLPKAARDLFKDIRSVVKYYQLKVQGEALGRILGKKRAQCIADMVPHVGMEHYIDTALKKTIIFTSYVTVVDATNAYLKKAGYKPAIVYGDTNNELAAIVGRFEKDPDLNPLIATYASLSTAVPLVMANEMIMLNSPFRSYEMDQAIARCRRQGQDQDVNVEHVLLDTGDKPNISTRSRDILTWSRQQVEEILDFKNPSFAMESLAQQLRSLPEPEFLLTMEEFLEDVDGFQTLPLWARQPTWANGW